MKARKKLNENMKSLLVNGRGRERKVFKERQPFLGSRIREGGDEAISRITS